MCRSNLNVPCHSSALEIVYYHRNRLGHFKWRIEGTGAMSDDICIYTIVMQHILQYKAGHRKEFCVPINCVFQRNVLNLCEPAHISAYKNRATCYNKQYRKKNVYFVLFFFFIIAIS